MQTCQPFILEIQHTRVPHLFSPTPQFVRAGETVTFTLDGFDPDGGSVRYEALNFPEGAEFDEATGLFTWTPTETDIGNYDLRFTVTDDEGQEYSPSSRNSFAIVEVYSAVAELPIIEAIENITVQVGDNLDITFNARSSDGSPLTFFSVGLPNPWFWGQRTGGNLINMDPETGRITGVVTGSMRGTYPITIIAQNEQGLKTAITFELEVVPSEGSCWNAREAVAGACALLEQSVVEGHAAGFHDVEWEDETYRMFYRNRDIGHSVIAGQQYRQWQIPNQNDAVSMISYAADGIHLTQPGYSTVEGPLRVSFTRHHLGFPISHDLYIANTSTGKDFENRLASNSLYEINNGDVSGLYNELYRANFLQIYPALDDFIPAEGIDLFMGNVPYMLNSIGRSWSDLPFVEAAGLFAAALSNEMRGRILEAGMFVPVFQMALRMTMQGVDGDRDIYLTGAAHPIAFEGSQINYEALVQFALDLNETRSLPPMASIEVLDENFNSSEVSYTSPGAIGRVWQGTGYMRSIVLDARSSFDVDGEAVSFDWSILTGAHPDLTITYLNEEHSLVRIDAPYQDVRVDIALFVTTANGQISAPAILSLSNDVRGAERERRVYTEDGRILELYPPHASWDREVYHYELVNDDYILTHIERHFLTGRVLDYTPDGREQILSRDAEGRVLRTIMTREHFDENTQLRRLRSVSNNQYDHVNVEGVEVRRLIRMRVYDEAGAEIVGRSRLTYNAENPLQLEAILLENDEGIAEASVVFAEENGVEVYDAAGVLAFIGAGESESRESLIRYLHSLRPYLTEIRSAVEATAQLHGLVPGDLRLGNASFSSNGGLNLTLMDAGNLGQQYSAWIIVPGQFREGTYGNNVTRSSAYTVRVGFNDYYDYADGNLLGRRHALDMLRDLLSARSGSSVGDELYEANMDLNSDGTIDARDVRMLDDDHLRALSDDEYQMILDKFRASLGDHFPGFINPELNYLYEYDFNGDNIVSNSDFILLRNLLDQVRQN